MVYRELIIKMEFKQCKKFENELEIKVDEFIKETQRKKYLISCCAICCSSKAEYERKNEWTKSQGFFCSQLVAAAYLKCGIMTYTKGTGYYLPGAFSQSKNNLELNENFSLGPEIIIDFSM
jgi:formate dehydrogenase assembly factor FdhD